MWKLFALFALVTLATVSAWPADLTSGMMHGGLLKAQTVGSSLEKMCNQNGPNTYSIYKSSIDILMENTSIAFIKEVERELVNKEVPNFVSIHCRIAPDVESALSYTFSTLKQCLNPKIRNNFQALANIVKPISTYGCNNAGKPITSFIQDGGVEWYVKHSDEIERCAQETIKPDVINITNDINVMFGDMKRICRVVSNIKKCIMTVMNKCPKKSVSKFVEGFFIAAKIPACH